jgi:hypothetical protein
MPILKRVIKRRQTRRKETQRRRSQKRRTQRRGGGPQEKLAGILKGKVENMDSKAKNALLSQKNSARMLLERGLPLHTVVKNNTGKETKYDFLVKGDKVYYMPDKGSSLFELGLKKDLAQMLTSRNARNTLLSQKNSARVLLERGIPLQLSGEVGSYSYLVIGDKVYYMTNKNTEPQELGLKKELLS